MENKKLLTGLVIIFIAILLSVVIFGSRNKPVVLSEKQIPIQTNNTAKKEDNSIIFFYGSTCPHCADVEAWMKENKVEEKITIIKKEVYDNRQNSQELTEAAKNCGLPIDSIGVPFLYVEGKCLVGTPDIINYLTDKLNSPMSTNSAERITQ